MVEFVIISTDGDTEWEEPDHYDTIDDAVEAVRKNQDFFFQQQDVWVEQQETKEGEKEGTLVKKFSRDDLLDAIDHEKKLMEEIYTDKNATLDSVGVHQEPAENNMTAEVPDGAETESLKPEFKESGAVRKEDEEGIKPEKGPSPAAGYADTADIEAVEESDRELSDIRLAEEKALNDTRAILNAPLVQPTRKKDKSDIELLAEAMTKSIIPRQQADTEGKLPEVISLLRHAMEAFEEEDIPVARSYVTIALDMMEKVTGEEK